MARYSSQMLGTYWPYESFDPPIFLATWVILHIVRCISWVKGFIQSLNRQNGATWLKEPFLIENWSVFRKSKKNIVFYPQKFGRRKELLWKKCCSISIFWLITCTTNFSLFVFATYTETSIFCHDFLGGLLPTNLVVPHQKIVWFDPKWKQILCRICPAESCEFKLTNSWKGSHFLCHTVVAWARNKTSWCTRKKCISEGQLSPATIFISVCSDLPIFVGPQL